MKGRIAIVLALLAPEAVIADQGGPVTAQDLSGRTFCWNNGHVATYAANGRFSNSIGHHARWSVVEPGVLLVGNRYEQIEVLPDGRLQLHVFILRRKAKAGGPDIYLWATPCAGSST